MITLSTSFRAESRIMRSLVVGGLAGCFIAAISHLRRERSNGTDSTSSCAALTTGNSTDTTAASQPCSCCCPAAPSVDCTESSIGPSCDRTATTKRENYLTWDAYFMAVWHHSLTGLTVGHQSFIALCSGGAAVGPEIERSSHTR